MLPGIRTGAVIATATLAVAGFGVAGGGGGGGGGARAGGGARRHRADCAQRHSDRQHCAYGRGGCFTGGRPRLRGGGGGEF